MNHSPGSLYDFCAYEQLAKRNDELVRARLQLWFMRWACIGLLIGLAVWPSIFPAKSAPQMCERPGIMQLEPETVRTKPGAGVWL